MALIAIIFILTILFFIIRHYLWVIPHKEISSLRLIIFNLNKQLESKDIDEGSKRIALEHSAKALIEQQDENQKLSEKLNNYMNAYSDLLKDSLFAKEHEQEVARKLEELSNEYEDLKVKYSVISGEALHAKINEEKATKQLKELKVNLSKMEELKKQKDFLTLEVFGLRDQLEREKTEYTKALKERDNLYEVLKQKLKLYESESNLTAIPYMAQLISDFETYELEHIAKKLDWGSSQERLKKVKSLRGLRADAKAMVEKNKEAQYQLSYLLKLFPELEEIIECEFKSLPHISINLVENRDIARDYLSKEEYASLFTTKRNQLALDRYLNSHNKSKWQIGRDYEQFVGYKYTLDGYTVDNFGTYKGLEDLGRDVIAKKESKTLIIQCKYWSSLKLIHEKHITQLYGTVMSYCIENDISEKYVTGVLITNITLSDTAKEFAKRLHIEYIEELEMGNYPCIKCNLGATGEKIYHLPFDQQYDATKIEPHKGEFYALTVKEAEDAGFRRAHKYFGS